MHKITIPSGLSRDGVMFEHFDVAEFTLDELPPPREVATALGAMMAWPDAWVDVAKAYVGAGRMKEFVQFCGYDFIPVYDP